MNIRKVNILLYFLIILIFYSCGVSKIVRRNKIKNIDLEEIYSEVKSNELDYNSYSIKYSAKINLKGSENSVNGILRIKKDSAIWISVSPGFGVELMRLLATPDSVKLLNKLNNTYFVGDYTYLNKIFNFQFDYYSLQSILTNSFFAYNSNNETNPIINFTSKIDSNKYFLQSLPKNANNKEILSKPQVMQQITILPNEYKILKIFLFDYIKNRAVQVNYSNFIEINEKKFPKNLNFSFNTSKNKSQINLKYNKIVINKQIKMPFKISTKYLPIK
ncbi:MAG: DUF4292 domain-containing protein [Bacteroidales bacterium]|nr:DUF4292 domain-containing protein [Bacteroidales bacterium]